MNVLDLKYYMPTELNQDFLNKMENAGLKIKKLANGDNDVV